MSNDLWNILMISPASDAGKSLEKFKVFIRN